MTSNWTKEEIMAYADGQLEASSTKRIQDAIKNDIEAKNFYETMIYSDDIIKDAMQQLESQFRIQHNSSLQNNLENAQKDNINQKVQNKGKLGARILSVRSIFIPALVGLSLFASIGYFIGQNTHKNLLMRGGEVKEIDKYRNEIENFLDLGSDGEKYIINEQSQDEMRFTIISTNFNETVCRKIAFENIKSKTEINACKDGETWAFQLLD